jgi:AcrR family transcriptional regulator
MSPRKYEQRTRAASAAETRRRIVEATVALHASVGPARTTISAIAERAGVQRLTVYRHFPDEAELFAACSAHWLAGSPLPDPAAWSAVEDGDERLAAALRAIYAWYRDNEGMLANTERDAAALPALAAIADPGAYLDPVRDGLSRGADGPAVGHALAFSTWRSLTREQGLSDAAAAALMVRLAAAARE